MPAVQLPQEFFNQLSAGNGRGTATPGADATYHAGGRKADVYWELSLDGATNYKSMGMQVRGDKLQLVASPNISCPADDLDLGSGGNSLIAIKVCDNLTRISWVGHSIG